MDTDFHVDTIAAQATPPGRGGVAIVRVSGPRVKNIIRTMLGCELVPRIANYLSFRDKKGDRVDQGIAIFFPHPHSFTGEDVLELHGHGGPIVVDTLLQCLLHLGARMARPGEFSERAFLNGKIDLTQAEAIADLIDASSKQAARSALRSLQGCFSKEIHELNEKIIDIRMYIEASIDFTDEEIDFLSNEKIQHGLTVILHELACIQKKAKQGNILREGMTAVIAGEPNVGKSSLLNGLSGKNTAIVTDIPGTTRDILRDDILIDGMPLHIMDTAGLRESEDIVEQEGIRRAYHELGKADIVLYVLDGSHDLFVHTHQLPSFISEIPTILIRNKIDLVHEVPSIQTQGKNTVISLSAKLGTGIDLLKQHIKCQIGFEGETEDIFIARRRHLDALSRTQVHVSQALVQLKEVRSVELAAEDLRLAQRALDEITGEFSSDDLLSRIFSSFCIGK